MIIVEGPDGAGKTTLIKQLQAEFNIEVAPRVVTKNAEAMVDLKAWVEKNLTDGFQYQIFDRHRLISEFIYGPLLRKEQEPGFSDLTWAYMSLNRLYNEVSPVIIYCLPPLETVRANIMADHENAVVANHVDAMYTAYVHRAALDWVNNPGRVIVWDYTRDDLVERMSISDLPGISPNQIESNILNPFRPLFNYAQSRTQ